MKNFVFLSPNFPTNYWKFCKELKENGMRVLGIGDEPYEQLDENVKNSLHEYYKVGSLENYDEVYRAVAFFAFKYGRIDWLESNPCMYDLGNFVLKQALTDAVEFRKSNPDFFINVNMSAKQLERKTFCGVVMALLKETGFPAGQLCLELTERCRSMPVSVMEEKLLYLKQHGVRLAMDDYGTGSASSSVLLQTPMDEIKIDMSFIRGITDNQTKQALVRSMVDFANKADLKSCLEGVEDEKLQNYLRSFGATWFQGYYYSKPVQAAAMQKLLNMEN